VKPFDAAYVELGWPDSWLQSFGWEADLQEVVVKSEKFFSRRKRILSHQRISNRSTKVM
jgi:hypothetical protein